MHDIPINALQCDRCGHTVSIPVIAGVRHLPREEMEQVIQTMFFAAKRIYGERGWFTSVGFDLCPKCCRETGTPPGFGDNGLLPETTFTPRKQTS